MPVYMVERDLPGVKMEQLAAAQRRAIEVGKELTAEGKEVRYIRSTFVPGQNKCCSRFKDGVADNEVPCVTRNEDHLQLRENSVQSFSEFTPTCPRHDHIGEQQVDLAVVRFGHLLCGVAICCCLHPISLAFEKTGHDLANALLVFREEDRFFSWRRGARHDRCSFIDGLGYLRQIDFERGSMARFAIHPDVASALFYDAVHHRKSEPSALSRMFCREEWLKDARPCFTAHTSSCVANHQHDVITTFHDGLLAGVRRVDVGVVRFDRQPAAPRHRIPGVDDQVHQNLFDLARISLHASQVRPWKEGHLDVFSNQTGKHLTYASHYRVQVQNFALEHLHPAEG